MRNVAIVGVGQSHYQTRRTDTDFPGLLQEGARFALDDAGFDVADVDMFVLGQAPDALHGFGQPEQASVGSLGAAGKPVVRVHTGGATGASAAQVGWWAVASGAAEAALVVGAENMGDCTRGAQEVLNKIWDPAYESLLPLNTIVMSAFHAVRYMDRFGIGEEHYALITSRLRANGMLNERSHLRKPVSPEAVLEGPLLSWPVRRDMSCPRSSGACAVLMVSEERARSLSAPKAWVRGIASRSNTYFMGDKMGDAGVNDHATFHDLALATSEAYEMAGITDPAREIQVAEPYVPFSVIEPAVLEALQLCEPGKAAHLAEEGVWDLDGRLPVNPSGGVVCTNPIATTALVRVAEAALQVRGRANGYQVDGVRTAVATGVGGSYQFWVTAVLAAEPAS